MMMDSVDISRLIKRTKNKAMDTANFIALKNKDNYLLGILLSSEEGVAVCLQPNTSP